MRRLLFAAALFVAACGSSDAPKPEANPAPSSKSSASAPPVASASPSAHVGHDHGAASAAPSAPAGPPPKGASIDFPGGAGKASGYLATPKGDGKHPAILLVQEFWGLNAWMKQTADRFADQGYVALAVDLYRGKVAADKDEAHELMRGLPEDRGLADLEGGVDFLTKRMDVDAKKVGVIGWCMGGGYAANLATQDDKLAAVVINYGHLIDKKESIDKIKAPLLGNFGDKDRGIPADDVKRFAQTLKDAKKEADLKVYPGAGHAFMNPGNKEGFDKAAADDAWQRIDAFFAKKLKGS